MQYEFVHLNVLRFLATHADRRTFIMVNLVSELEAWREVFQTLMPHRRVVVMTGSQRPSSDADNETLKTDQDNPIVLVTTQYASDGWRIHDPRAVVTSFDVHSSARALQLAGRNYRIGGESYVPFTKDRKFVKIMDRAMVASYLEQHAF